MVLERTWCVKSHIRDLQSKSSKSFVGVSASVLNERTSENFSRLRQCVSVKAGDKSRRTSIFLCSSSFGIFFAYWLPNNEYFARIEKKYSSRKNLLNKREIRAGDMAAKYLASQVAMLWSNLFWEKHELGVFLLRFTASQNCRQTSGWCVSTIRLSSTDVGNEIKARRGGACWISVVVEKRMQWLCPVFITA